MSKELEKLDFAEVEAKLASVFKVTKFESAKSRSRQQKAADFGKAYGVSDRG